MYGQDFEFDVYFDANLLDEQKVMLDLDDALKDFGEDYNDIVYDYLTEFESEQMSSSSSDEVLPEYLNDACIEAFVPAPTAGSQAEYAEFMEATIRENEYILEWLVHQGGQDLQQWQNELEKSRYQLRQLNQDRELLCLYPDLSEENFELLPVNPQKDGDKVEAADIIEVTLGDTSLAKAGHDTIAEEDEDGDAEEDDVMWEGVLESSNGPEKSEGNESGYHSLDTWRTPTPVQFETTGENHLLEKLHVFHSSQSDGDDSGYRSPNTWRAPTLVHFETTSKNYLLEKLDVVYSSRSTVPNPQNLSAQGPQTLQAFSNDTMKVTEKPFILPGPIQEPEDLPTTIFDSFVTDMRAAIIEAEKECRFDTFAKDLRVVLEEIEGEMQSDPFPRDMQDINDQAPDVDMSGIGKQVPPPMQPFASQKLYDTKPPQIRTIRYDSPRVQRRNSKGSKDKCIVAKTLHKIKECTTVVHFFQDGNNPCQKT